MADLVSSEVRHLPEAHTGRSCGGEHRRHGVPRAAQHIGDTALVRFAGMDVTVYSSDTKRSPGHLSRQGSPELRWATFEAAKCAAWPGSPDYGYYQQLATK
ncbi:IS110 family transposase, partial [Mycobacterium persicum]